MGYQVFRSWNRTELHFPGTQDMIHPIELIRRHPLTLLEPRPILKRPPQDCQASAWENAGKQKNYKN
jgi:hypothetical protein